MNKLALALALLLGMAPASRGASVEVRQREARVSVENGVIRAVFATSTGRLISLVRLSDNLDIVRGGSGYFHFDYRPLNPDPKLATTSLTATPELKVIGPAAAPQVEIAMLYPPGEGHDFEYEIHYVLRDGDSGFYIYSVLKKTKAQPDIQVEAAGWKLRVNPTLFDYRYMHDQLQGPFEPLNVVKQVMHDPQAELMNATYRLPDGRILAKHMWVSNELASPVYGATGSGVGVWFVYGSFESIGGVRPHNEQAAVHETDTGPILLETFENNYYGRGALPVSGDFAKLNGPFFVYVNGGPARDEMWADAKRRAAAEAEAWPYTWLKDPLYPQQRGSVSGVFSVAGNAVSSAGATIILGDPDSDWQSHKSPFLFWTHADATGHFTLAKVRPGNYTLYAWVPGAYGESRRDDVEVKAEQPTDVGRIVLTPLTRGRLIWQIGTPDRSAAEFAGGDRFREWDNFLRYHSLFPNDVTFTIGRSHEQQDWFYFHPASLPDDPRYRVSSPASPVDPNRTIPYRINFDLPAVPAEKQMLLTLAFCSVRDTTLNVSVNDVSVARLEFPYAQSDSIGIRAGMLGTWRDRVIEFDSRLLHPGTNSITLRHARPNWVRHVIYDFVRLEAR